MKRIILTSLLIFTVFAVSAQEHEGGEYDEWDYESEEWSAEYYGEFEIDIPYSGEDTVEVILTGYRGTDKAIQIPSAHGFYYDCHAARNGAARASKRKAYRRGAVDQGKDNRPCRA